MLSEETQLANHTIKHPLGPGFWPELSADQLLPFHCAMLVAAMPPAVENKPPTYNVPPDTASAYTLPFSPEPRADQVVPFHCAT